MSAGPAFSVWMELSDGGQSRFSLRPAGVSGGDGAEPISPHLPLGFADAVRRFVEGNAKSARATGRRWFRRGAAFWRRQVIAFLESRFQLFYPWDAIAAVHAAARASSPPVAAGLSSLFGGAELEVHALELLEGRALFAHEAQKALRERGIQPYASLDVLLDACVRAGELEREPGVRWLGETAFGRDAWACSRCGSDKIGFYPCHHCGLSACPQCDDCRSLGPSKACSALYHRPIASHPPPAAPAVEAAFPFRLSDRQQAIADELRRLKDSAFVWAACGAGKTEVTVEAICETINAGGRALFAVPRRDVADQLARRFADIVRGVDVVHLSGETPHKHAQGPLIVATVHQAVRFRRCFQLIVVDEIDAYPLNAEPWLLWALERSLAPNGRAIAMSATPPEATARLFGSQLRAFTLPARHHGHPLPVPRIRLNASLAGVDRPLQLQAGGPWLDELAERVERSVRRGRKLLIFVPYVRMAEPLAEMILARGGFRRWNEQGSAPAVAHVHSLDEDRRSKARAMEEGTIDVLVSTSVLERGVTLARLDVLVFAADCERIFDSAALVQMAGRVGRKSDDPTGSVEFLAATTTPAMREAVASIEGLNALARREGLLRTGARG